MKCGREHLVLYHPEVVKYDFTYLRNEEITLCERNIFVLEVKVLLAVVRLSFCPLVGAFFPGTAQMNFLIFCMRFLGSWSEVLVQKCPK